MRSTTSYSAILRATIALAMQQRRNRHVYNLRRIHRASSKGGADTELRPSTRSMMMSPRADRELLYPLNKSRSGEKNNKLWSSAKSNSEKKHKSWSSEKSSGKKRPAPNDVLEREAPVPTSTYNDDENPPEKRESRRQILAAVKRWLTADGAIASGYACSLDGPRLRGNCEFIKFGFSGARLFSPQKDKMHFEQMQINQLRGVDFCTSSTANRGGKRLCRDAEQIARVKRYDDELAQVRVSNEFLHDLLARLDAERYRGKFVLFWLDYMGCFVGNAESSPQRDIDQIFARRLLADRSVLAITLSFRSAGKMSASYCGEAVNTTSRYIQQRAIEHGFVPITQEFRYKAAGHQPMFMLLFELEPRSLQKWQDQQTLPASVRAGAAELEATCGDAHVEL
jgi:hypothetical protein